MDLSDYHPSSKQVTLCIISRHAEKKPVKIEASHEHLLPALSSRGGFYVATII